VKKKTNFQKQETVGDFKDRIAAKIRGVSVETFILTKKLTQQENYRKLVTRTKKDVTALERTRKLAFKKPNKRSS